MKKGDRVKLLKTFKIEDHVYLFKDDVGTIVGRVPKCDSPYTDFVVKIDRCKDSVYFQNWNLKKTDIQKV